MPAHPGQPGALAGPAVPARRAGDRHAVVQGQAQHPHRRVRLVLRHPVRRRTAARGAPPMTEAKANPRTRARGLKTWSAFGNLGRRPTEYEILTHNLNHTTGAVPLEMGPGVHGNVWLREHRDSIKLTAPDWDGFRDPDAVTYGSYVADQDDQETYVEGLLERFDGEGYDASLSADALDLLATAATPGRYLAHRLQLIRPAAAAAAQLAARWLENRWRDSQASQRWTTALVDFLDDADAANPTVLQGDLAEFAPLGHAMIDAGAPLIASPRGRGAAEITADTGARWSALLDAGGLRVSQG